jgi:hypothetical protein
MDTNQKDLATKDIAIAVWTDQGHALRERSTAEYLFVAAAIGAFAAIVLGVAALQNDSPVKEPWVEIVAAIGIFMIAAVITIQVLVQHNKYSDIKKDRAKVAELLQSLSDNKNVFPTAFLEHCAGHGHRFSLAVLWTSAAVSMLVCLSLSGLSIKLP